MNTLKFLLVLTAFIQALSFNFMTFQSGDELTLPDPLPELDQDLQTELDLVNRAREKTKQVACKLLLRNALSEKKHPNMDKIIESKSQKQEVLTKIIEENSQNCVKNISNEEVKLLLNPQNGLVYNAEIGEKLLSLASNSEEKEEL